MCSPLWPLSRCRLYLCRRFETNVLRRDDRARLLQRHDNGILGSGMDRLRKCLQPRQRTSTESNSNPLGSSKADGTGRKAQGQDRLRLLYSWLHILRRLVILLTRKTRPTRYLDSIFYSRPLTRHPYERSRRSLAFRTHTLRHRRAHIFPGNNVHPWL